MAQSQLHLNDQLAGAKRLVVNMNTRLLTAQWKNYSDLSDTNGRPLIEQFRISGLGGGDTIEFVTGSTMLDVSDLTERSDDWVGVIDGAPAAIRCADRARAIGSTAAMAAIRSTAWRAMINCGATAVQAWAIARITM